MFDVATLPDHAVCFLVFRRHTIFFYRIFSVDRLALQQYGAALPRFPATIQEERLGWHQFNEMGRDLFDELCAHCLHLYMASLNRGIAFHYDIHRPLIRPGQVLVRLEYSSPALPHITVFAGVCRSWNASIGRIVQGQPTVNHGRLIEQAQRSFFTFYWSHSYHEDEFTFFADLIPETQLLIIRSPVP